MLELPLWSQNLLKRPSGGEEGGEGEDVLPAIKLLNSYTRDMGNNQVIVELQEVC